jgi:hypothetical protein
MWYKEQNLLEHVCNVPLGTGPGTVVGMAWMAMMGADSVEYHEQTVAGRSDDPVIAAAAYYASRGETPMTWGAAAVVCSAWTARSTWPTTGPSSAPAAPMTRKPGRGWSAAAGPASSSWSHLTRAWPSWG